MKGLWFVLFIIALQVISGIIQHRKKQQERKAREEAMRQRVLAQGGVVYDRPPQAGPVVIAPPTTTGTPADLESRRKAQLEQLRQRREGRRGSVADVETRIPTTPARRGMPVPTQLPQRRPTADQSIIASEQARLRAQETARRAREAERQRREQQARLASAAYEAEEAAAHQAYEQRFHSVAGEEDAASHGVPVSRASVAVGLGRPMAGDRTGPLAAALLTRLREPAGLREVILLREVLDRPLALRDS